MAGSAIIGALRVVLGADSAALESGLKDAQQQLARFSTGMVAVGTAIGATLANMASKIGSAVKGALDEIGQLGKLSTATGVPIEQLSALAYAAKQAGASTETLGNGLKGLGQSMMEAAGNARSDAARAFTALGVTFRETSGQLRPVNDVLLDLADRFQKLPNGAQKAAIATALLRDAGFDLIGMLSKGRDWLERTSAAAKEMGFVIDGNTRAAVKNFNENVKQINTTFEVFTLQLAAAVAPLLDQVAKRFREIAQDTAKSTEAAANLTFAFRSLVTVLQGAYTALGVARTIIVGFWKSITNDATGEAVLERLGQMWDDVTRQIKGGAQGIAAAWDEGASAAARFASSGLAAALAAQKGWNPIAESAQEMKERLAAARAELQALIDIPTVGIAEKMVAVEQAWRNATISMAQHTQMTNAVLKQLQQELRAAFDLFVSSPAESYTDKVKALNQAVADGTVKNHEFGRIMKQIHDENVQQWSNLATAAASALTQVFAKSKVAAIAAAIINTAEGITKALAKGGFFGYAHAALIAATGIAQISKIKSTNLTGGGSAPSLGGGSAAAGSGAAAGAAAGAQLPAQTLHVTGMGAGEWFSGDAVRELAQQLVAYQKDGGVVIIE